MVIDKLKAINNPYERKYRVTHFVPEVTFEGGDKKPDFGEVTIVYIPSVDLIELKSLKYYFYQFRNKKFSYERFVNVVFDDISLRYKPVYLKVSLRTMPRGGISSLLEVES